MKVNCSVAGGYGDHGNPGARIEKPTLLVDERKIRKEYNTEPNNNV